MSTVESYKPFKDCTFRIAIDGVYITDTTDGAVVDRLIDWVESYGGVFKFAERVEGKLIWVEFYMATEVEEEEE